MEESGEQCNVVFALILTEQAAECVYVCRILRIILCKDDSALFPEFLHCITQDLGRYVASVGLGWYLPHATAGVEGRVVVNAELGLLGLFLQQLEREKNRENFQSCSAPRIILKQIRETKAIIFVDYSSRLPGAEL
jgi:hypothetical protein